MRGILLGICAYIALVPAWSAKPKPLSLEAVVVSIQRESFPHAVITARVSGGSAAKPGEVLTLKPGYSAVRGKPVNLHVPANYRLLASYYLMPGDRIIAVVEAPSKRGMPWTLKSLERISEKPALKPAVLQVEVSTNRRVYQLGDPITITLTVTNRGGMPAPLTFTTSQRYDLTASRSGREVWRWSYGRAFAQVIQNINVRPGETISFEETWDQTDKDGDQVPPGSYTIIGWLTAEGREQTTRSSVEIRIAEPEIEDTRTTKVEDIARAPRAMANKEVTLQGHYRGASPTSGLLVQGGPPVSRRDWVLEDETGSIYVSGARAAQFRLQAEMDVQVRVQGIVKLARDGRPYIHAWSVQKLW